MSVRVGSASYSTLALPRLQLRAVGVDTVDPLKHAQVLFDELSPG